MADGRNKQGQFVKGYKGGPGRPKRNYEERYIRWMSRRVKKKDWDMIVDVAIANAKAGNSKARQWLSDYLIGKPPQQVQVEGDVGFRFPEFVEVRIRGPEDQPPSGAE